MHIDEQKRVALRNLAGELRRAYGTQRESAATTQSATRGLSGLAACRRSPEGCRSAAADRTEAALLAAAAYIVLRATRSRCASNCAPSAGCPGATRVRCTRVRGHSIATRGNCRNDSEPVTIVSSIHAVRLALLTGAARCQ